MKKMTIRLQQYHLKLLLNPQAGTTDGGQVAESTTPASQVGGVEGGRGAWTATSGTLTLDEETPVYAAPDKDSGAVSTLPCRRC